MSTFLPEKKTNVGTKKTYETFQYVPIIETLKLIMSHSSMRNYVRSEQNSSDNLLVTFRDGISYKQYPFFLRYPDALRIQLYYDDVVLNNPLGSKVFHPHKIGAFYFVIQNLPQYINSSLGGIHILSLCHTADIQKYGMKAIFKPFLLDLNKLESDNGVNVIYNGTHFVLRASIAAVCADGLAPHQLLGFLSPSAKYFCRLCMINRDDFKNNRNLNVVSLRTKQLHDKQLKEINTQQTLKEIENSKTKSGILEDSALHSSRFFHCTNNFVFDPMHDILEGIAPMELKLVLHYYSTCDDYNFNIDMFNNRINLFRYGLPENKNKPSVNFSSASIKYQKDYKLSQTAVQTWCLLKVFPFVVSDLVPENDKYLSLILILNRINKIVFAPTLTRSILPYLSELIEEHNCLFRELFPAISPINKHHHLTHYPQFWGTNEEPRIKLKYGNGCKVYVENTYCWQQLYHIKYQGKDKIIKVDKAEVYSTEYRKGCVSKHRIYDKNQELVPCSGPFDRFTIESEADMKKASAVAGGGRDRLGSTGSTGCVSKHRIYDKNQELVPCSGPFDRFTIESEADMKKASAVAGGGRDRL
ncbi:uncharacterized protein LOC115242842 [Formica exsecta]|uniref:uncharacterized protein LOC115242842 n=1 Tax=Formica exsecta TaxID=72781 RepID=UPI001142B5E4|nr:uncharacterized protein LOC115242842 [Formica exsecta]